ncbi:hypothetical protein J6590_053743 [Homalodisca vitripennis]|nr:hypothetical protein J6590_053743 [Homalodisca vitripennis]
MSHEKQQSVIFSKHKLQDKAVKTPSNKNPQGRQCRRVFSLQYKIEGAPTNTRSGQLEPSRSGTALVTGGIICCGEQWLAAAHTACADDDNAACDEACSGQRVQLG